MSRQKSEEIPGKFETWPKSFKVCCMRLWVSVFLKPPLIDYKALLSEENVLFLKKWLFSKEIEIQTDYKSGIFCSVLQVQLKTEMVLKKSPEVDERVQQILSIKKRYLKKNNLKLVTF